VKVVRQTKNYERSIARSSKSAESYRREDPAGFVSRMVSSLCCANKITSATHAYRYAFLYKQ
jgi:hypothetical protein